MTERRPVLRGAAKPTLMLLASAILLFPFYWMFLTALKPETDIFAYPPELFPRNLAPGRFVAALWETDVVLWLTNTAIVAGLSTLCVLPVAMLTAYGLARHRGRRVSVTALVIVVTQMMPPMLLLVPYFILFREFGLMDGYAGLVLANFAWGLPVTAWLMKAAFEAVPVDLEEAALVDGCTWFGAIVRIALPLALPGLAAAGVFAFIAAWDEYFFARTLVSDSRYWVVAVGLGSFTSDYSTSWQKIMAVATFSTLPPAILFLFVQRAFIANMAAGSVKG